MTILGIGSPNGGMMLDEIGDIHRFSTPSKLLAVAWLDPSVKAYYDASRTEGRTHYNDLGTVPANLPRSSEKCLLTK